MSSCSHIPLSTITFGIFQLYKFTLPWLIFVQAPIEIMNKIKVWFLETLFMAIVILDSLTYLDFALAIPYSFC